MLEFTVHLPSSLPRALPPVLANPRDASLAAAGGVRDAVKQNFLSLGGRQFYQQAAASTFAQPAGADAAEVCVRHTGVALRLMGGTVRPRRAKLLAIPTTDTDLWPSEMSGLAYIPLRRKGSSSSASGKLRALLARDGRVLFLLVTHAEHRPNPAVLPTQEKMQTAALHAITQLM